jgi:hypothetical protein
MTIKKLAMIGLASSLAFGNVVAQETTGSASTSTTSTEKTLGNKVKGDIDEEITNARMRAANGSKSKISASLGLGYTGSSLKRPFDGIRPNLSGTAQDQSSSQFSSSLSGRYRINQNQSITAGIGVQILQPLQKNENLETNNDNLKRANEVNIQNPSIAWSSSYKIGDYQAASSVDYTQFTNEITKTGGLAGYTSLNQTFMKSWGTTGFSSGIAARLTQYLLNSNSTERNSRRDFGLYPMAEYQINDTFVARTVFGYFNYTNTGLDSATAFRRTYEYQSIGLGIVASRNVWIYPNIQFVPDELEAGFTNVSISATINLF